MKRLLLLLLLVACIDQEDLREDTYIVQGGKPVAGARFVFGAALPDHWSWRGTAREAADLKYIPGVVKVSKAQEVKALVEWNLDVLNQRGGPPDGIESFPGDGGGVTLFTIDTGILPDHPEFGGRASIGVDVIGGTGVDCMGHGTGVSSVAVGATRGVARKATVIGVRVLNCSGGGDTEGVIRGIDWVIPRVVPGKCVANMSLGTWDVDSALNAATNNLARAGCMVVVAAGNHGGSACTISPASAELAYAVGSFNISYARSIWSALGPCVKLFAPGEAISTAFLGTGFRTWDGTSFAAPHLAGCMLIMLANDADPLLCIRMATPGLLSNGGEPNLALFVAPSFAAPDSFRVESYFGRTHGHAHWRDTCVGETGFELQRSADEGQSWVTVTVFPADSQGAHWEALIRDTDLFRLRCSIGDDGGPWSSQVRPTNISATSRHVH